MLFVMRLQTKSLVNCWSPPTHEYHFLRLYEYHATLAITVVHRCHSGIKVELSVASLLWQLALFSGTVEAGPQERDFLVKFSSNHPHEYVVPSAIGAYHQLLRGNQGLRQSSMLFAESLDYRTNHLKQGFLCLTATLSGQVS